MLGAVAWLIKSIVTHFLSKDIDSYKMNIKYSHEADLEQFRSSLKMMAFEHETRFSRLHEKRADILALLYEKLAEAVSAAASFISPVEREGDPSKIEKYKKAMEKMVAFYIFFDRKRIFLSEPLCTEIDEFVDIIRDSTIEMSVYLDVKPGDGEVYKEKTQIMRKAWKSVKDSIVPDARKSLENEFRKILEVGVNQQVHGTQNSLRP